MNVAKTHPNEEPMTKAERHAVIAQQNDQFRQTWGADFTIPGQILCTPGITEKGFGFEVAVMKAVMQFDDFTKDNSPYGERDFGSLTIEDVRIFWKFDLYDADYQGGTPDATNPAVTRRVLTIMLPEEY